MPDITKFSHAKRGIRLSFIPGQRIEMIVAMIFTAVPMLPKPEANRAIVHGEKYVIEWFHRYKLENSRTRLAKSQCVPGPPGLESPICFQ